MTAQADTFAKLHIKGSPLRLYNAWDAGSASAVARAGAKAIATSSWSVAAALGWADGEDAPLDEVLDVVERITATVQLPVTVDFEGGYSEDDAQLSTNIGRLLDLGVAGINFEDRVVTGEGLHSIERQAERIATIRVAADKAGVPLFVNARTDLFLGRGAPDPADSVAEAIERSAAYAKAGASGLFIPGLIDLDLVGRIVDGVSLPVNVMMMSGAPDPKAYAEKGVARLSWGNASYVAAMASIVTAAGKAFA